MADDSENRSWALWMLNLGLIGATLVAMTTLYLFSDHRNDGQDYWLRSNCEQILRNTNRGNAGGIFECPKEPILGDTLPGAAN